MDAVYNSGAVWGVNMEKLRQDHYTRVQDRCKKRTRYFIDEDRAYAYKSCVYLENGKCTLKACVRKEGK